MDNNYTINTPNNDELFKPVNMEVPNYIKVIGVGGGGGNAVNHMMEEGIKGVDFILCNTDYQALMKSNVKTKVHLGKRDLGAGNDPRIGREAAEMSRGEIESILDEDTKMLFVTAGMGGGTGTGAAPVIAKIAKDRGILTVGIVTMPMEREGRRRKLQALSGIDELKACVDTLILISTDKLRDEYGNMRLSEAFKKADDVLTTAAKGIAEIITVPGYVNVDFEDVTTVMKDSGKAIMGTGIAEGENRAQRAIEDAIKSPLLNDSNIEGAKNILLYITSGSNEVTLDEVDDILEIAQNTCGNNSDVIWGNGTDESLGEALSVTLIATGFNHENKPNDWHSIEDHKKSAPSEPQNKKKYDLEGNLIGEPKLPPVVTTVETPKPQEAKVVEEPESKETETPVNQQPEEEKVVHTLFSDEEEEPLAPIDPEPIVETTPTPKPTPEPTPIFHPEEEKPVVRIFDNPFRSTGEDDGFEITSHFITKEEVTAKAEQEVALMESKKAKQNDPKEELKKQRLRALSMNFRTQKGLEELENQPAYLRRNVDVSHSNQIDVSHYTTSKEGISGENPFLHDNVD
ncbi:MAG: cell division protein FtsZ [Bacteroidales bacterium]|nr:cell division protein FtsZ [Bacteroidales bacterium]